MGLTYPNYPSGPSSTVPAPASPNSAPPHFALNTIPSQATPLPILTEHYLHNVWLDAGGRHGCGLLLLQRCCGWWRLVVRRRSTYSARRRLRHQWRCRDTARASRGSPARTLTSMQALFRKHLHTDAHDSGHELVLPVASLIYTPPGPTGRSEIANTCAKQPKACAFKFKQS